MIIISFTHTYIYKEKYNKKVFVLTAFSECGIFVYCVAHMYVCMCVCVSDRLHVMTKAASRTALT